jgi:dienelactone hydrolase
MMSDRRAVPDRDRGCSARSTVTRRSILAGLSTAVLAGISAAERAGGVETAVTRVGVRDAGLVGTLFLPARPTELPAIVSLAGAVGGLWEAPARALAEEGFAALALATHNYEGRPPSLRLLPVEYVEQAVDWLRTRAKPKRDVVALRGWSRGGELALLAASLVSSVNAVLAYSPRCYVGREQNKPNNFDDPTAAAAWTYRGAPLTGEALPRTMLSDPAHQSFEDIYGIAAERIKGPIMFVSGQADTGLAGTTATFSCNQAMRRLELFGSPYPRLHLSYPDAGHNIAGPPPFAGPVEDGGTLEGDTTAVDDSWPRSLAFLRMAAEA